MRFGSSSSRDASPGMQRQGAHLFSLPSSRKKRHQRQQNSISTIDSSITTLSDTTSASRSSPSQSPEGGNSIPLSSSSRSSFAGGEESSDELTQDWSLLSIVRVEGSSGMVLVAIYHLGTSTLYTWPLQTNPNAPQPKQGTVFIAPMNENTRVDEAQREKITSESLKILSKVVLLWMRQGASRRSPKVKLGEREEDTEWLRYMLNMPKMEGSLRKSILEKQIVSPVQEWSGMEAISNKENNRGVLSNLSPNITSRTSTEHKRRLYGNHLRLSTGAEKVPSIEISSPNTSDMRSKTDVPWLKRT